MDPLILILIMFFILLITYQTFLAYSKRPIIEGNLNIKPNNNNSSNNNSSNNNSSNNNSSNNNTSSTEQQNASDISAIKTQLTTITHQMQDVSGNVANVQKQVNDVATAQQQSGEQMVGTTTPTISGTS